MKLEKYTRLAFFGTFAVPIILFAVARLVGVPSDKTGFVIAPAYFLLLFTSAAAYVGRREQGGLNRLILKTNGFIVALAVVFKILGLAAGAGGQGNAKGDMDGRDRGSDTTGAPTETRRKPRCALVRKPDTGGTQVPWEVEKTIGRTGWIFFVSSYHHWHLQIDMKPTANGAEGTAVSEGSYSPWYSLSLINGNATSKANGAVTCDFVEDKCVATATGGEDSATDTSWSSAVLVKPSSNGADANLEITGAVAYEGHVTIKKVAASAGVTAGPATASVSVDVELPPDAKVSKKIVRNYPFRCERIDL